MSKKLTTDQFIEKAKQVHGNIYDYSLVNYINNRTKIKIICPIHGMFEQIPNGHLQNYGCYKCGNEKTFEQKLNFEKQFIEKAKQVHNNKYDYSLVEYEKRKNKVKIICPIHGIFEQTVDNHIHGSGCYKCGKFSVGQKLIQTRENFIKESILVHGNIYDYSLVDYTGNKNKVKIICSIHGEFQQTPNSHISCKTGCPKCKESHGEKAIRLFLNNNNIKYISQYKFNDCRYKRQLPFDFYLPDHNICIEFDGEQHFTRRLLKGKFMSLRTLEDIQRNDQIKTDFCKNNNIKLLRITYLKINTIEKILSKHLKINA